MLYRTYVIVFDKVKIVYVQVKSLVIPFGEFQSLKRFQFIKIGNRIGRRGPESILIMFCRLGKLRALLVNAVLGRQLGVHIDWVPRLFWSALANMVKYRSLCTQTLTLTAWTNCQATKVYDRHMSLSCSILKARRSSSGV